MALSRGPKIVTSGLVLALDAADKNSYRGSGTDWTDISGNGNNGTLTNGPTFNSANGGSIVFDGVDDSVSCGTNTVLNVGNNITVNVWFYINLIPAGFAGYQPIVSKVPSNYSVGWEVVNSLGVFRTIFRPSATLIDLSNGSLVVGNWYMGTMTFDNATARIYLNGIQTGSTTTGGPVTLNSNQPLQIGTRGAGNFFNGNISQVSIYNRALTATEILRNYNATKTRFGL